MVAIKIPIERNIQAGACVWVMASKLAGDKMGHSPVIIKYAPCEAAKILGNVLIVGPLRTLKCKLGRKLDQGLVF